MGEPTPTMYPFGMACKEFSGVINGTSFTQFYFVSAGCKPDQIILIVSWAFTTIALMGVRNDSPYALNARIN